jgi:hypothetical protein
MLQTSYVKKFNLINIKLYLNIRIEWQIYEISYLYVSYYALMCVDFSEQNSNTIYTRILRKIYSDD